jgi:hypothetical protein
MTQPRIPVKVTPLKDCEPIKFHAHRYKLKFLFNSSPSTLYSKLHQHCRLQKITLHGPLFECLLLTVYHRFTAGTRADKTPKKTRKNALIAH